MCPTAAPAPAREPAEARSPVAGIFRRHGPAYLRNHVLTPAQAKVLRSVVDCRTVALGGHFDVCRDCGTATPSYNSCRDRHCPGCQASAAPVTAPTATPPRSAEPHDDRQWAGRTPFSP